MALISPWTLTMPDYLGNVISFTCTWDNATLLLLTLSTFRDAACLYHNIYFGLGANGVPDTSSQAFGGVPAGTTVVGAGLLNSLGFVHITDVFSGQITAGP